MIESHIYSMSKDLGEKFITIYLDHWLPDQFCHYHSTRRRTTTLDHPVTMDMLQENSQKSRAICQDHLYQP